MQHRVLLLSANFGSGHLSAARAIAGACRELAPTCVAEAVTVDNMVLDLVASGYLTMLNRVPFAYRSLYYAKTGSGTRRLIRSVLARAVWREIARVQPTAVVATHPFPAGVAAELRRRGLLSAPVAVALTDFHPHPLWVHDGVDRYFAASAAAAAALRQMGVQGDRLSVNGLPIRHTFAALPPGLPKTANRRVLVMGGGLGLGPVLDVVGSLAAQPDLHVTVAAGRNAVLYRDLTERFGHDPRMEILDFTDRIPACMAESTLLVTKPGGMTCAEALASGLPMLLMPPLPGHEEENAAYLENLGAAVTVAPSLMGAVAADLTGPGTERLLAMRAAARQAGRADAALQIANQIFIISKQNRHISATA